MIKTALSTMQAVRKRLNLDVPSTIESVTDPDELQQIQELIDVSEELRQARCFIQSRRSHVFGVEIGRTDYQLPLDFYGTVLSSSWNETESLPMIGPVSDSYFNYLLYGEVSGTTNYTYRLFGPDQNPNSEGGQFKIYPVPSSDASAWQTGTAYTVGETVTNNDREYICTVAGTSAGSGGPSGIETSGITDNTAEWGFNGTVIRFDYISRHLFLPKNWEPDTAYSLNDKVNVNGNIYICTSAGTSSSANPPSGLATSSIADNTAEWGYDATPYEEPTLDTDLCLFDYDLLKHGLRAMWISDAGGSLAQQEQVTFRKKIDKAQARLKGSHVGSLVRNRPAPRYSVPYKSWSFD